MEKTPCSRLPALSARSQQFVLDSDIFATVFPVCSRTDHGLFLRSRFVLLTLMAISCSRYVLPTGLKVQSKVVVHGSRFESNTNT